MRASNRRTIHMVIGSVIGLSMAFAFGWSAWPLNRHDCIILGAILVGALAAHAAGQQHLPRDRRRDAEGRRTVRADPLDRPYRYRRLCRGAPPPARRPNLGSAGLKSTPVWIEPIATEWRGFVVVRGELATPPDCLWATRVAVPGGTAWDMAGNGDAAALDALLPKG